MFVDTANEEVNALASKIEAVMNDAIDKMEYPTQITEFKELPSDVAEVNAFASKIETTLPAVEVKVPLLSVLQKTFESVCELPRKKAFRVRRGDKELFTDLFGNSEFRPYTFATALSACNSLKSSSVIVEHLASQSYFNMRFGGKIFYAPSASKKALADAFTLLDLPSTLSGSSASPTIVARSNDEPKTLVFDHLEYCHRAIGKKVHHMITCFQRDSDLVVGGIPVFEDEDGNCSLCSQRKIVCKCPRVINLVEHSTKKLTLLSKNNATCLARLCCDLDLVASGRYSPDSSEDSSEEFNDQELVS
jgi:hypothetical protein